MEKNLRKIASSIGAISIKSHGSVFIAGFPEKKLANEFVVAAKKAGATNFATNRLGSTFWVDCTLA